MYCKYCYRLLEDGTDICTACGKSQTVRKKNQKKLFGLIPVYREKDLQEAKDIFYHSEAAYKLARESTTALDFITYWGILRQKNAALRTYEEIIHPETFQQFSDILSKESEFQWRLRDAIEASKRATISDLKGEYRNNVEPRVFSFFSDLDYVTEHFDAETANYALAAIDEIANLAGVNTNFSKSSKTPDNIASPPTPKQSQLDEFAKYGGVEAELLSLDLMEGHNFEYWCANALRDIGYSDVEVTPGSGDQGVDILAEKDGVKYAIQCKCYSSNLGNTPIQEVNAGKSLYRCHVGAVITNQFFTPKAKELAEATGTLLWDRNWIKNYLETKISADGSLQIIHNSEQTNSEPQLICSEGDEYLSAAVDIILETGQASVSVIQRHLKLGYARAARIIDEMEERGIVGPFLGSRPRVILITKEEWRQMHHE